MKMSSYSKSKVSAFFGSHHDNSLRESIRQDVLIERYDDLQREMEHLEHLMNISENHFNDDLFAINETLFDLLETLIPELKEEKVSETEEILDEAEYGKTRGMKSGGGGASGEPTKGLSATGKPAISAKKSDPVGALGKKEKQPVSGSEKDADSRRKERVAAIKDREKKAAKIFNDKEAIIRAKSLIRTAQQTVKGADNPEAKKRARTSLNRARQQLVKIGK